MTKGDGVGTAVGYCHVLEKLLHSGSDNQVKVDFALFYLNNIFEALEDVFQFLSDEEQVKAEKIIQILHKAREVPPPQAMGF